MSDNEELKKIQEIGDAINLRMKALEDKHTSNASALEKVKELDTLWNQVKDNPDKIKELGQKVEEVIIKLNRPDFGKEVSESYAGGLEKTLKKGLEGVDFDDRNASKKIVWDMGQRGLIKAVGTITNANFTDSVSGLAVPFNPDFDQQLVTSPRRKVHMRSVVPILPMSGDAIRYQQHKDHGEGEIGIQVNHGDKKQQIEENYEMVDLIPRTIAGFYRVSKQEIADVTFLTQSLLSEGTERFLKVEDAKFLYGVGGSNDIKGINEYAAVFAGDMPNYYEAILNPIFELLDQDEDPNSVLIRPSTYCQLLKYKTTTGEYNFPMLFVPDQQQPLSIAGVPINMSTAVRINEGFVGDWSANNIQIRVREALSIAFAYEDADNFTENLVTIRLEAREALQLKRANAFRKIDFTQVAPAA
ncbi:phage major capsid protein [Dyadobacter sp. CY261]|uniref:phage major capsid protein n=1 Tax=Dyadobacter sp. CY261 TaxID=2907203 RepID=UPI001F2F492B|nr:phage major capsid protein [Dyadobacter sp. CY261]MCF0074036.1 phage major capsid protein [Dyadobacter sp. CY261]